MNAHFHSSEQCVTSTFEWIVHLFAMCKNVWHIVHCPLMPVTVQQCHIISCELDITTAYLLRALRNLKVKSAPTQLQAPSVIDAIKWAGPIYAVCNYICVLPPICSVFENMQKLILYWINFYRSKIYLYYNIQQFYSYARVALLHTALLCFL